jgi:hypothetical protein
MNLKRRLVAQAWLVGVAAQLSGLDASARTTSGATAVQTKDDTKTRSTQLCRHVAGLQNQVVSDCELFSIKSKYKYSYSPSFANMFSLLTYTLSVTVHGHHKSTVDCVNYAATYRGAKGPNTTLAVTPLPCCT